MVDESISPWARNFGDKWRSEVLSDHSNGLIVNVGLEEYREDLIVEDLLTKRSRKSKAVAGSGTSPLRELGQNRVRTEY